MPISKPTKQKFTIGLVLAAILAIFILWLFWGPDSWDVNITGVTGDGRGIQYRIDTVYAGTSDTLIFRNADAAFMPPYFKFDSADVQAIANRIARTCPGVPVTVNGYGMRIAMFNMFPNITSIDAPQRCLDAPIDN